MVLIKGRTVQVLLLLSALSSGCADLSLAGPVPRVPASQAAPPAWSTLEPASYRGSAPEAAPPGLPVATAPQPQVAPFAGDAELSVEALVEQVLAQNPSLPQMIAAWEAARARYPQVTSLDDPSFGVTVAPASIGSSAVEFGYRLEVSQHYPFPGKLRLRGQNALAEASAAGNEVEDTRLQLIEAARAAFYDYYLLNRAIAVNQRRLELLNRSRKTAETLYRTGKVEQQDVFQTDVEIGRQRERDVILEQQRQVAVAHLNTLMHLPPDLPLPPPPKELTLGEELPDATTLRAAAYARRPDLRALENRIAAEQASLDLAQREYYPDFDVMAAYDTIMGNGPMRDLAPQIAVRANLPVRYARRAGAVSEAQARIAQRRAELARLGDQANYEVQQAYAQVRESERVVRLYEKEVLPAAESNVKAAATAYGATKIPLLSLIEAQRNVTGLQDRYYEAVADYFRRLAALERAVGGSLALLPPPGLTPPGCSR